MRKHICDIWQLKSNFNKLQIAIFHNKLRNFAPNYFLTDSWAQLTMRTLFWLLSSTDVANYYYLTPECEQLTKPRKLQSLAKNARVVPNFETSVLDNERRFFISVKSSWLYITQIIKYIKTKEIYFLDQTSPYLILPWVGPLLASL